MSNEIDVADAACMQDVVVAAPMLKLALWLGSTSSVAFALIGGWMIYMGATGASEIDFFGAHLKTGALGVAAMFLGATCLVLTIRKVMSVLYELARLR